MHECEAWFVPGSLKDPCNTLSRKFTENEEKFPTSGMISDIKAAMNTNEGVEYAFVCSCHKEYSLTTDSGWTCHDRPAAIGWR